MTTDPLLDKADALMRRRGFNANLKPTESPTPPLDTTIVDLTEAEHDLTEPDSTSADTEPACASNAVIDDINVTDDAPAEDNDIPILTDIVDLTPPQTPLTANDLQKTFDHWLAQTLPQTVAAALDGMGDRIINELRERARAEFLSTENTDKDKDITAKHQRPDSSAQNVEQ